jgi:L-ascorbate metabolism protein UlaG (beta-lactamase superfamily)
MQIVEEKVQLQRPRSTRRSWLAHLWREWIIESWRSIPPAFARPQPFRWTNDTVTAAWLGHSTVLINFFGINILTDPVLFARVGIRLPGFTIGPKRLTAPALTVRQLPPIDLILLSHAHFDHFDLRTLRHFGRSTHVVTARDTADLLRWTRFREISELTWNDSISLKLAGQTITVTAIPVKHWGARVRKDDHRGYNAYLIERNNRRVLFSGDTAYTDSFAALQRVGGIDVAAMSIGCYDPWIRSHCNPEQAVQMANDAGAQYIIPIHHQTFRLSFEPFRELIERFERALADEPQRIALREIGETFVLPM